MRALQWCISPVTGNDGRPSWSKLVTAGVLVLYALSANLPATVAIVAICAAHGTKVLLAVIQRSTFATTSATALTSAVTKAITERRTSGEYEVTP